MSTLGTKLGTCQNPSCTNQSAAEKYQVCSGCKQASYCSAACQKAHWKDHKGPCKQSRLQLSKAVAKSEPAGNSALSQPGFVPAKIAEDIREWTNRNTDWLGGCYFQAAKLSTNSHFWRTHGVVVVLTPHNTRQSTYKFTFADAYSLAFPEMLVLAAEKGQGELFKTLLKQVPTGKSLEGDALFTSIVFIRCLDVLNIVPQVTAFESLNIMTEHVDWKPRLSALLKAPSGINNPDLIDQLSPWWQANRTAIVFCCVNLLKLKKGGPIPDGPIDFEILYSEESKDNKTTFKFNPLPPCKITWDDLGQLVSKIRGGPDLVKQLTELRTMRAGQDGKPGTIVIAGSSILGVCPTAGPWFITDEELENIEVREDWEHHFYTLLVDYDLKYR